MEQVMLWVTIFGVIIIPLVGWIFNSLITRKIDGLEEQLNGQRKAFEENYVRKDIYDQAITFHQKETDNKFHNLVETMNKQFENMEGKIDDVKDLINEKFNGNK